MNFLDQANYPPFHEAQASASTKSQCSDDTFDTALIEINGVAP